MHLIIALFSDNRGRRHLTGASGHSFNTITRALRSQQAAVRAATLTSQRLATPRRTVWPSAPLGAQTAVSNGGPAVISLTVNPPAGRQAVLFDLVVFFLFLGGGKWTEFIQRFSNLWPLKALLPNIPPFMHTFKHRRRCQPWRAKASSSGAVRVRRLAQGHLDAQQTLPDFAMLRFATRNFPANLTNQWRRLELT